MTELFVPVLCGAAGISGYAAFLHGRLALRSPMQGLHLLFAVLCVLATSSMIAAIAEAGAQDLEDAMLLRQLGTFACMLYLALLPWFIREYTHLPWHKHLVVQSCGLLIVPMAGWLLFPQATSLSPSPARYAWLCVLWVGIGGTFGWSLYASWREFQTGMRRRALALGAGLILLLAALLTHLLSDLGLGEIPKIGALGLAALLIPMSVELDRETRQSRSRLKTILENLPAPAYVKSADGRYQLVNSAFEQEFDRPSASVIGKTDFDVFAPEQAQALQANDRAVRESRVSLKFEEVMDRNGAARNFESIKFPLFSSDGMAEALCGLSIDVTDIRKTEQEMQSLRKQAWHADRVERTGALAASLAHELTQPLTAILSNAQAAMRFLSRDDTDLDEIRAILQDIVRDDKRAAGVINGLRAMLRRQDVPRERIDLRASLEEVIELMHSEFLDRGVDVGKSLVPRCMVMSDKTQLQQVMLNLLLNACEAMATVARGERHLWISMARSGEKEVRIAVRDSGPPIPEEQLSRVFDSFFTTKQQGLGMGLAVCRSIIQSHGGSIHVERNPDRGVTFLFTLPLASAAESSAAYPLVKPLETQMG
jgi:PAS domain S-box-containing protein